MMAPGTPKLYAGCCSWTRKTDEFDQAITEFSNRYAHQHDLDYRAFAEAIASGRPDAVEGL